MASAVKLGDVDLLPGEIPLKNWTVERMHPLRTPFIVGSGSLYLTNKRLIFSRPASWPYRSEEAIVLLDDVTQCVGDGWFLRGVLKIRVRGDSEFRFYPEHFAGINASEIAHVINGVLQERHADHG